MTRIEQLEAAVGSLPAEEYRQFRDWFFQRDWDEWDRQIEKDSDAGRLDFLLKEAEEEKQGGSLRPL
jgi:hypothetical protein